MKKQQYLFTAIFLMAASFLQPICSFGQSGIPQTIAFQGFLSSKGVPVTQNGITASFSIYDDPTATTGHNPWNSQSMTVDVKDGYYSTILDFSNSTIAFNKPYWLQVTIGTTTQPRIALNSVPYALNAQNAQTANLALSLLHDAPVGSIMPYAFDAYSVQNELVAKGWKICDGSEISKSEMDSLYFDKMQSLYGYNSVTGNAYLPDFRGLFLRGVNSANGKDRQDSLADPGGRFPQTHSVVTGNGVGTLQMEAFKDHRHGSNIYLSPGPQPPYDVVSNTSLGYANQQISLFLSQGPNAPNTNWTYKSDKGGLETRPKNAAVYWLIKVK